MYKFPTLQLKKWTIKVLTQLICFLVCLFVCFVLQHIKLIGHLMPNQVKENKSEKKFKGEVLGINDEL